ncbi:zinc finger protein ZFPM1 isoform X1 [Polypterus senegalus]|uniref:zinc finger protein ZFPM1 isoform X1 n=1 Tax=Polypterus senegalus TaxID=55291 RepID=UPI001966208F|nr:zinc finger protein ZFPM1 isoform X1 [Polypterus senegalus]
MSRRKQSKPRQIKRSLGPLEEGEDSLLDEHSFSEEEGGTSDQEGSLECDSSSPSFAPLNNEGISDITAAEHSMLSPTSPTHMEDEDPMERHQEEKENWNGPGELELCISEGKMKVRARQSIMPETSWGPYKGKIEVESMALDGVAEQQPIASLDTEDQNCWLVNLSISSDKNATNSIIYSKGEELYCKTTLVICKGDFLIAGLAADQEVDLKTCIKTEPIYPENLPADIQLLPQQAGMAAILATAVVNKDIFPCKDCGIWYRSERNLQAHLMYYCASRQKQQSSPSQEKSKDVHPNERVCPFPHCNKSCPSASSLEIHMRTHSGERPFVCLICLSAFTTKANCERHLKVHTDTLNGICHGCGFISTTRDILYSHLVTNHMVCQPGSKSEVYSPGSGLPALPFSRNVNCADPGQTLKCPLCGFLADSVSSFQQHTLAHVEASVKTEQSPTRIQSSCDLSKELEEKQGPSPLLLPQPSVSPEANQHTVITTEDSSPEAPLLVKIKEEPKSAANSESENELEDQFVCQDGEVNQPCDHLSRSTSPKRSDVVKVKTELSSPTPGSSPVHFGTGTMVQGGTVFLPQYMFSPEASIVPQASEILAKMSEMVHSRLKQGQGAAPTFYPGSPIQKGATCFECDITFININNYYVHKRLYCSSRHHQGDTPLNISLKDNVNALTTTAHSSQSTPGLQGPSTSQNNTEAEATFGADVKVVEVKSDEPGLKDASSEGENGSRASEGSQSPSNSLEELDEDPTKTFCEACNIRFSRHDNYMVHKRYYCATRHDPPHQRQRLGKVTLLPQPVRTRKRRKMYEIHMAQHEALASLSALTEIKQEGGAITGRLQDSPSVSISHIKIVRKSSASSPSSSPDCDAPIDLSKKPRLKEEQVLTPLLSLADYHKCTPCGISFNSVENYLAHKKYYCPATPLQQKTIEQLQKVKRPASSSPKSRASENKELNVEQMEVKGIKLEKNSSGNAIPVTGCTNTTALSGSHLPSPESNSTHQLPNIKATQVPGNSVVCPYCPLNGVIKGDLMEHFRSVHGLLLTMQAIGPTAQNNHLKGTLNPSKSQESSSSSSLSPRVTPTSPTTTSVKNPPHKLNGKEQKDTASPTASPLCNGSPQRLNTSPKLALPVSPAAPFNISPVPENFKETGLQSLTPPLLADKSNPSPKVTANPMQNGNSRFCRLCNIKFSSLSTFIAHKKYYCSSHSAEHVK